MWSSDTTTELYKAIIEAQAEMPVISKDSENPFFKKKYAGLPAIMSAIRPILKAHDLAVIQGCGRLEDGTSVLHTRIIHKSGEWIEDEQTILLEKATCQGMGSGITYSKRYGLCAMLGIVADEDDDGNKASGNKQAAPAAGSTNEVSLDDLL